MPTAIFIEKRCFCCSKKSSHPETGILFSGQPLDLDFRPGDSNRTAIYMYVQRCRACGYCATDLGEGPADRERIEGIVKSPEYIEILTDKRFSDTVNAFKCASMIHESAGDYAAAGDLMRYSAWCCDDDKELEEFGKELRAKTALLYEKAINNKQQFNRDRLNQFMIIVDLFRRAGMFDKAEEFRKKAFKLIPDETREIILMYQEDLLKNRDTSCHTIDDALENV